MKVSSATAVPAFLELNGKQYRLRPLSPRDLGELERFLADAPIHKVKRQLGILGEDALPEERKLMIREAQAQSELQSSLTTPAGLAASQSFEGFQFTFWLSIRDSSPGITLEEAAALVTAENFEEIQVYIKSLNEEDGATGQSGKQKTQTGE